MSDTPYTLPPAQMPRNDIAVEPAGNGAATHPLTDRMAQGAHHTIDRLADAAAPQLQRLDEAVAGARLQMRDQARQAHDVGDVWAENLRTTVRRHPLTAVVAAMAVGALLARLTR